MIFQRNSFFAACFAFLMATAFALAQTDPAPTATPQSSPAPDAASEQEAAETTPSAPEAPAPSPTPAPKALTLREIVDSMNVADIQETMSQLKENYIRPESLDDEQLSRALLEGVIHRISPGALLLDTPDPRLASEPNPFYAEILDGRIGYLRIGSLNVAMLTQLDAALERFNTQEIYSVVLDLRTSPMAEDFETAVEVIKRFVEKGKLLFTIRRPGEKQERIFTSNQEPVFTGILMILADKDTAGPSEVIAACLRSLSKSMVVGEYTAGQGVEYSDRILRGGQVLRLAVGEVDIPQIGSIFPAGLKPDFQVALNSEDKNRLMRVGIEKGVSGLVFDKERPRRNEAALVAGTIPEIDDYQQSEKATPESNLRDPVLQRAVDLITTISIYEGTPGGA